VIFREAPEFSHRGLLVDGAVDALISRQHAFHIAVENGMSRARGNGEDGSGG
jgi:hypothetical protein